MSSIARDGILNEDLDRSISKDKGRSNNKNDRTRSPSVGDDDLKHEDGGPDVRMADAKPTYKSWKKKYRKMRIKFDQLQAQNEELYQLEQKAMKKTKQLAIHNDRLLDLLLDINNRPQIPPEKRVDLSLPVPSDVDEDFVLPIDKKPRPGPKPGKSLRQLIKDVPHLDFAATSERFPDVAHDLLTGIDSPAADSSHQQHPPSFLTADDIDNYLWEVDCQSKLEAEERGEEFELLPTLAPLSRDQQNGVGNGARGATPLSATPHGKDTSAAGASSISTTSRDFAMRNPTSVYNWLRKHAPKTFLQDNEAGDDKKEKAAEKSARKAHRVDEDEDEDDSRAHTRKSTGGTSRKASGEGRASTATSRAKGERSSKRSSAAHGKDKRKSMDETMYDLDDEIGVGSKSTPNSRGKRKRPADDDTGYRPKGGSSRRPPKKRSKNNSLGGASVGGDDKIIASMHTEVAARKKDLLKAHHDTEDAAEAEVEE